MIRNASRTALALLFVFLLRVTVCAQGELTAGFVSGRAVNTSTGTGVQGATVTIAGRQTQTDLDGGFRIERVPVGAHDLAIEKAGFQSLNVTGVRIAADEVAKLDLALTPASDVITMEKFTLSAEMVANSGAGLLAQRQKAIAVSDSIGSDQMSRLGFNDAAQAMKAVTGASVVDGKYVYIRGLGERYSSTSLNGAEVPSADPERRAVQMDLFPAELIDAIVTSKTFTPDRPGNFSGGNVDIRTKTLPDTRTLSLSLGTSYNSQSTGEPFMTYAGGEDWLGRDDGSRQIPAELQAMTIPARSTASDTEIGRLSRLFSPVMAPTRTEARGIEKPPRLTATASTSPDSKSA